MHYFQFNIGDYHSHTAHLEPMEDLAYRRMLDWCYLNEMPLPLSVDEIARIIRMRSHNESIAIVLQDFFERNASGYSQARIDLEVAAFREKSAKAKKSAKARWDKKPSKTKGSADADALQTQSEGNAKHKPLNTNHKPLEQHYALSRYIFEKVSDVAPHAKEPNHDKWGNTIRLMVDRDKIDLLLIKQVFDWANNDSFWKVNILSADKLRKQFPKLHAKMVSTNGNNQQPNYQMSARDHEREAIQRDLAAIQSVGSNPIGSSGGHVVMDAKNVLEPMEKTVGRHDGQARSGYGELP